MQMGLQGISVIRDFLPKVEVVVHYPNGEVRTQTFGRAHAFGDHFFMIENDTVSVYRVYRVEGRDEWVDFHPMGRPLVETKTFLRGMSIDSRNVSV